LRAHGRTRRAYCGSPPTVSAPSTTQVCRARRRRHMSTQQPECNRHAHSAAVSSAIAAKDAHDALRDSFVRSMRCVGHGATAEAKRHLRSHDSSLHPNQRHRVDLDGPPRVPRGRRASLTCVPPAQPPPTKARPRRHSVDGIYDQLDPCAAHWLMSHAIICKEPQGSHTPRQLALPGSLCGQSNQPLAAKHCTHRPDINTGRCASGMLSAAVQAHVVPHSSRHGHSSPSMASTAFRRNNGSQMHKTQRHSPRCCGLIVYTIIEAVRDSLPLPALF
jgi:hypothetical protein